MFSPVLRLGGAEALSHHILGLWKLLEKAECLDEDETAFIKDWLSRLSADLFVGEDETPYSSITIRRAEGASDRP